MLMVNELSGFGGARLASSFLPSNIASLWSWIDPAVNSFQLIAGTTAATADNDPLGYLTDRSGNARHWIAPANNSTRPVLKTSILNSLPVLRFASASSQEITCNTSLASLSAGEVMIILKKNADPAASTPASGLWTLGTSTDSDHLTWTDSNAYIGPLTTARKAAGNPTPSLSSTFRLHDMWSATSDFAAEIDGSAFYSTATNTFGGSASPKLGKGGGAEGARLDGDVAEMCIFSAKLSGSDRTSMKNYFATKYALTIA